MYGCRFIVVGPFIFSFLSLFSECHFFPICSQMISLPSCCKVQLASWSMVRTSRGLWGKSRGEAKPFSPILSLTPAVTVSSGVLAPTKKLCSTPFQPLVTNPGTTGGSGSYPSVIPAPHHGPSKSWRW